MRRTGLSSTPNTKKFNKERFEETKEEPTNTGINLVDEVVQ